MIKKHLQDLACQYPHCTSRHISWIIDSPHRKTSSNAIPGPVAFCGSPHVEAFMKLYNQGAFLKESGDMMKRKLIRRKCLVCEDITRDYHRQARMIMCDKCFQAAK